MRKIAFIFILILCMTNQVSAHNKLITQDEMTNLADLTIESNLEIDKWQVTFKENMPKDRLLGFIKQFKDSYIDSYSEDENIIKYTFRNVQKNAGIVENYSIVIPKNSNYKPELISVISGDNWSEAVKSRYLELQESILQQYFTNRSTKFACLTTVSDGIIKGVYLVDLLKEKLQIQHISTQTDNVEESMNKKVIYGYTPSWQQKFTILGNPVNVNIAITNTTNGETKVTVGTPILITEY
ncbi:YwmB family TATA-box binding protein [Virgibacillus necropolis]|uniref:YwmB family TATA-box binding protein n=1 Tax=Virgibacillus necropolis TaxID=163877 RepID=UPI0038511C82